MTEWATPILIRYRWMRLSHLADDVAQICALVEYQYHTDRQRAVALDYELRSLRRTQWDRRPTRPPTRPSILRPSVLLHTTGYRHDAKRKRDVRLRLDATQRSAIARLGAARRNAA